METNDTEEILFKYDIEPPKQAIDMLIPYTIRAEEHESVILSIWVIDVAGQNSEIRSKAFFWWEYEEMVCFPNPFNPDRGEISTITLEGADITEAKIFDSFGNLVRILRKESSVTFFEWDGRNGCGEVVGKGGYICVVDQGRRLYCKIAVWR
jgi:hypothetical protein